jgi:hypothetical protein
VAAGKTIADDKYKGVINKLDIVAPIATKNVIISIGFFFANRNCKSVF